MAGLGFLHGDGKKILFWSNEQIRGIILKYSFPRIFALAINKDARVNECRFFNENLWTSNVPRPRLFDWKEDQWNHYWNLINEYHVCSSLAGSIIWKESSSGRYSSKCWNPKKPYRFNLENPLCQKYREDMIENQKCENIP
ncbi:hypothetical protein DITRI_Ditri01bG0157600 [Diplodiscus trichospermus]